MAVPVRNRRYLQAQAYARPKRRRVLLDPEFVARLDWLLIGACAAIVAMGLLMVYSSSRNLVAGDPAYFVKRQLISLAIGRVVAIVLLKSDYRKLRDYSLIA